MKRFLFCSIAICAMALQTFAQQAGDTVTVGSIKYVIKSSNQIPNPGFENGFASWTDATASASTLTSGNYTLVTSGGVDNSQYLVGITNANSSSAGSIGTGWSIGAGKTYYFRYYAKYVDATKAAGSEAYLKTSLTNDKTNSAEPLVLINSTSINSGGQWTLNSVAFTNSSSYAYLMVRFRWLGNIYGFDNFGLYEAFEMPDIAGLKVAIADAQAVYVSGKNGSEVFATAITTAQSYLNSESATDVKQAIATLKTATFNFKLQNASAANPLDMTSYIANQGFDDNTSTGWSGAGTVNYHEVEYYQKTFDLNQQVKGLPAGKYILKVRGFERPKSNDAGAAYKNGTETIYARFYAKSTTFSETTAPFSSLYRHKYTGSGNVSGYINTMAGAEDIFNRTDSAYYEVTLPSILVADGDVLTIGARSTFQQTGYWALLDNFKLQYLGNNLNDVADVLNQQVEKAQQLTASRMQNSVLEELNASILQAQQAAGANPLVAADLNKANVRITAAIASAQTSIAAYAALHTVLGTATTLYGAGTGNEAAKLQDAITTAQSVYDNLDATLTDINNATSALNLAILAYRVSNATGTAPTVTTVTDHARGATIAYLRGAVSGVVSSAVLERGICWSTQPNASVLNNKSVTTGTTGSFLGRVDGLQPATVYYMRAYAITTGYAVGYGNEIKVITIPKGTVTYSFASVFTGDNYTRINAAVSSAVNYYNNLTSIQGHKLSVNYNAGTPTAEASYGGYMQFGDIASYQQTGTALHEMAHTIGVGQYSYWTAESALKANGIYLGERATKVLRFMTNDPTANLKGDYIHFWPYGINGSFEDDGLDMTYTINTMIVQGLGEDGLPPTGGFALPAYTFDNNESVKYYIKNEDANAGRDNSFLVEKPDGGIVYRKMTASQATANDSTAWYVKFYPAKAYYTLQNAATGKYLTYKSSGLNGFGSIARTTLLGTNYFQLMGSRNNIVVGTGNNAVTLKSYWIIYPSATQNPPSFVANASNGSISSSSYNITDAATLQRWLILTGDQAASLDTALSGITGDTSSAIGIYAKKGGLIVEKMPEPSEINVYDIVGKPFVRASDVNDTYSVALPKGIYIVTVKSAHSEKVAKVVVL
jgi:hypothetical protein